MKKHRLQKRAGTIAALLACVSFAGSTYAQQDNTQEKIRLMVSAVQARDEGNLEASKQSLEELLKIAPNDDSVKQMLASVNEDIERQAKGEAPILAAPVAAAAEDAKDGLATDPAIAESIHKQQLSVLAAYDLIDEAYDMMDQGNWTEANKKLNLASEKLPADEYSPVSADARAELKRAKAALAKERAQIAMAERNVNDAKAFANDYVAAEENVEKSQAFASEVQKFEENPYNHNIKDISPDFAARQEKVAVLLEKGRRQYLYGDYQGARSTFRHIETLDANNIQAKAYQRLISEKLEDSGRLTYLATREALLDEVNQSWQRPQVYSGSLDLIDKGPRDSVIDKKLKDIIIPNVSFPDPGVPLAQAINTLSVLSVDYDQSTEGKKGVNMVLFDGGADSKNVILTLRDQSLGEILNWVTQQAGFQYDVENDTVVIRKVTDTTTGAGMDTIDFPITSATVTRMIGFKAAGGSDSSDPFGGGGDSGGIEDKEGPIKNFLVKAGVEFGPGASLAYDGTKLFVTNTRRNLDKVRNILLRYSDVKQVEIEAKFMEVNQGALKELGFNWNVYKNFYDNQGNLTGTNTLFSTTGTSGSGVVAYNNRPLSMSGSTITAGSTPITISRSSVAYTDGTNIGTTPGSSESIDQVVPQLPATINMASNAAFAANTVLGVINGYSVDLIVTALEQKQGSDMLSAPKVTVISGSTASITVSQQMRYPETWGDVQSNVGSGTSDAGSAGVTITPGTPQDFTTADVGVVMEVTPNVEEDGSINLTMNPKVTEFEGFMEYGGVAVAISGNTTVTVPSGFIQPVFSVREVRTSVTVFDGATVVLGGLTREEVRSVNDSVPILGDIPFLGRLFRSKGESRQKKNLLIFVTANRISPGGSVGREQFKEMRAGSVFQNPIIVSPGGAVQRVLEDDSTPVAER